MQPALSSRRRYVNSRNNLTALEISASELHTHGFVCVCVFPQENHHHNYLDGAEVGQGTIWQLWNRVCVISPFPNGGIKSPDLSPPFSGKSAGVIPKGLMEQWAEFRSVTGGKRLFGFFRVGPCVCRPGRVASGSGRLPKR